MSDARTSSGGPVAARRSAFRVAIAVRASSMTSRTAECAATMGDA
jgi:hypothetical protein